MTSRVFSFAVLVIVASLWLSSEAAADLFIRIAPGESQGRLRSSGLPKAKGVAPVFPAADTALGRWLRVPCRHDEAKAIAGQWLAHPGVELAEQPLSYTGHDLFGSHPERLSRQWHLQRMGVLSEVMPEVNVTVAIIDTGVDVATGDYRLWRNPGEVPGNGLDDDGNGFVDDLHGYDTVDAPEFSFFASPHPSEDFTIPDPDARDVDGHGTAMAAVAVAGWGAKALGVAPGARLMALRAGYRTDRGTTSFQNDDLALAIYYAAVNGADVMSMSLGGPGRSQMVQDALDLALQNGCIAVASAGNDGLNTVAYPAAYPGVIAVAGLDRAGAKAAFSNFGDGIDLAAPAVGILTLQPGGQPRLTTGTSPAAALVSGAIARLLATETDRGQVIPRLLALAAPLSETEPVYADRMGAGEVRLAPSLEVARSSQTPPSLEQGESGALEVTLAGRGFRSIDALDIKHISDALVANGPPRLLWQQVNGPWLTAAVELPVTVTPSGEHREALALLEATVGGATSLLPVTATIGALHTRRFSTVLGASLWGGPVVGDLEGDGAEEIALASNGQLHVLDGNGSPLPGWPRLLDGDVVASPLLADLDADGRLDVLMGTFNGLLYAHDAQGVPLPGWPVSLGPQEIKASPVVADLTGDGQLEVIVGDYAGQVHALDRRGRSLPGWPVAMSDQIFATVLVLEGRIIAADKGGQVAAFSPTGALLWSIDVGGPVYSSPVAGDVDGDGFPEILLGTGDSRGGVIDDSFLHLLELDGALAASWPMANSVYGDIALADLSGDGRLEIIASTMDGNVSVLTSAGEPLPGWPVAVFGANRSGPVVADVDGDGSQDIVLGTATGQIAALDNEGKMLPGFPLLTGQEVWGAPRVANINGVWTLLATSRDGTLSAWELPRARPGPWMARRKDALGTGRAWTSRSRVALGGLAYETGAVRALAYVTGDEPLLRGQLWSGEVALPVILPMAAGEFSSVSVLAPVLKPGRFLLELRLDTASGFHQPAWPWLTVGQE